MTILDPRLRGDDTPKEALLGDEYFSVSQSPEGYFLRCTLPSFVSKGPLFCNCGC